MTSCQTPPEPAPKVDAVPEIAPAEPVVGKAEQPETKPVLTEISKVDPQPAPSLTIESQARAIGARAKRLEDKRWEISKGDRILVLKEESRAAELNETVLFLNEAFIERQGALRFGELDYEYTLKPDMDYLALRLGSRKVVIDPVHGGT